MEAPVSFKMFAAIVLAAALGSVIASFVFSWSLTIFEKHHGGDSTEQTYASGSSCNVLGIQVHGEIVSSRADIPLSDLQAVTQSDGTTQLLAPNYTIADEVEDTLRNA